jgi:hypothetical protein
VDKLIDSIAKNPFFIVFTGICSVVSLVVSILNDKFLLWLIFTMCLFTLLSVIRLVNQNSRMFRRLDDLNCDIFNRNIDLEYDEDKEKYFTQTPLIIVITSFLTQETAGKNPNMFVTVDYPSQLSLDFSYTTDFISREQVNSNSAKFKITLKSEAIVITVRSLSLSKEKETEFLESDKKINVTFESDLLLATKKESLLVSL